MSELRQDLVSGDWIIVSPERFKRPKDLVRGKSSRKPSPIKTCPFENSNLSKSTQWPPILSFPSEDGWKVVVVPNKYPALKHFLGCSVPIPYGVSDTMTGAGEHDLVIGRDHKKNFADLSLGDALETLKIIQKRYRMLAKDICNVYSSTFFNWGASAGASVLHPHYQILTLPIIPPDIFHSLQGSERYMKKHKKCVHCVLLKFDQQEKKRIVDENKSALSLAPYVSRVPFEVRIFPKKHLSYFEKTAEADLKDIAALLQLALKRIRKNLKDPDLNFFIHTAPYRGNHDYYHWHIEIVPKFSVFGGFEIGTGIDINIVDPKTAAAVLKGKKI